MHFAKIVKTLIFFTDNYKMKYKKNLLQLDQYIYLYHYLEQLNHKQMNQIIDKKDLIFVIYMLFY